MCGHLGLYSLVYKGSESKSVRKRCPSIPAVVSLLSKLASRFQAFSSSIIRKRRNHPSLCNATSSLTRIHSRRRQFVDSTSSIIWWTSCFLFGKIIFSKNRSKNNFYSPVCPLTRAASRSPGSLRFPGDNGSHDAPPTGVFYALALSFAALSIGGVWTMVLYGAPSKLPMYPPAVLQTGVKSILLHSRPASRSCSSDCALVTLLLQVAPFTQALLCSALGRLLGRWYLTY